MKILVMSDSHGDVCSMLSAVRRESPELILHLGDHERDCAAITDVFPDIPLRTVHGNCDRSGGADIDEFVLESKRIFMTHGHLYGVKLGLASIINSAFARGANILLFGHTHNPYYANHVGLDIIAGEMTVVNPGSIGRPRGKNKKTYAVLKIKDGAVDCEFGYVTNDTA